VKYTVRSTPTSFVASSIYHTDQALIHNNLVIAFNNNLLILLQENAINFWPSPSELPAQGLQNSTNKGEWYFTNILRPLKEVL
jgi:hypothetical protein